MKILITGHKGFVGKYFMKKYESHDIVGIDIEDGNDARDFFKSNNTRFDIAIHLAAIVGGRKTIEGNPLTVATDLSIDAEFFQWVIKTQPKHIVYFSSSAAYPIKYQTVNSGIAMQESLINLKDISNPDFTYGWAKLSGEYLASFVDPNITNVHIFRPFSGYGSDQSLDYPFPSFIDRAIAKVPEFEIWGNGEQVRDFIHIQDIIDAVDEAIKLNICEPINLGSGIPTSFNDLANMIMDISGHKVPIKHIPSAPTGVHYRLSDSSKMMSFYKPKISLEEGIRMALDTNYHQSQPQ